MKSHPRRVSTLTEGTIVNCKDGHRAILAQDAKGLSQLRVRKVGYAGKGTGFPVQIHVSFVVSVWVPKGPYIEVIQDVF